MYESVTTLCGLEPASGQYPATAPAIDQAHVINHLLKEEMPGKTRKVMMETARIARSRIDDVTKFGSGGMDFLILPRRSILSLSPGQ